MSEVRKSLETATAPSSKGVQPRLGATNRALKASGFLSTGIPSIFTHIIQWLSDHAVPAPDNILEGVKKTSTTKSLLDQYARAPNVNHLTPELQPKDVIALLFSFLKTLSLPIIPEKLYGAFMSAVYSETGKTKAKQMRVAISFLSDSRREILLTLANYLRKSCLPLKKIISKFRTYIIQPPSLMNPHSKEREVVFCIIKQVNYLNFETTHVSAMPKTSTVDENEQIVTMPTLTGSLTQNYTQNETDPPINIAQNTEVELLEMKTASEVVIKCNGQEVIVPLAILVLDAVPETAIPKDTSLPHKTQNTKFMTMTALTSKNLTEMKQSGLRARDSLGQPPKLKEHSTMFLPPPSFEEAMKQLKEYATSTTSATPSANSEDDVQLPPPPPFSSSPSPPLPPPPIAEDDNDAQPLPPPEFPPPPLEFDNATESPHSTPNNTPNSTPNSTPNNTPTKSLLPPPCLSAKSSNKNRLNVKPAKLRESCHESYNNHDTQNAYSSDEENSRPPRLHPPPGNRSNLKSVTMRPFVTEGKSFIPPPSFDDHFLPPPPMRVPSKKQAATLPPPPPAPSAVPTTHLDEARKKWSELSESEKQKLDVKREKRRNITNEIVETEKTYTSQLEMFHECYQVALENNPLGLEKAAICNLFSNLNFIMDFHKKELLPYLEKVCSGWTPDTTISEVFINIYPKFKLYYHYVNNYENGLSIFHESKEKFKKFRKFIDNLDYSTVVNGLCFESLLILPVQRIPRYLLLLTDLKTNTPLNHPDYEGLCKAVKLYGVLADYLNSAKRKNEMSKRVEEVLSTLDRDPKITYSNKREHKGTFQCTVSKEKVTCFVFSDICIIAKQKRGETCPVKYVLPLVVSTVRRCAETELHLQGTSKEPIKLSFATSEQLDEAESLLEKAIVEAKKCALQETEGKEKNVFDFERNKYEQIGEFSKSCACRISEYKALKAFVEILLSDSNTANKTLGERVSAQLDVIFERTKTLADQLDERISGWKPGTSVDDLICDGEWLKMFKTQTAAYTKLSGELKKTLTKDTEISAQAAKVKNTTKKSIEEIVDAPQAQINDFFTVIQGLYFNSSGEPSQTYIPILQELRFLTTSV